MENLKFAILILLIVSFCFTPVKAVFAVDQQTLTEYDDTVDFYSRMAKEGKTTTDQLTILRGIINKYKPVGIDVSVLEARVVTLKKIEEYNRNISSYNMAVRSNAALSQRLEMLNEIEAKYKDEKVIDLNSVRDKIKQLQGQRPATSTATSITAQRTDAKTDELKAAETASAAKPAVTTEKTNNTSSSLPPSAVDLRGGIALSVPSGTNSWETGFEYGWDVRFSVSETFGLGFSFDYISYTNKDISTLHYNAMPLLLTSNLYLADPKDSTQIFLLGGVGASFNSRGNDTVTQYSATQAAVEGGLGINLFNDGSVGVNITARYLFTIDTADFDEHFHNILLTAGLNCNL